MPRWTRISILTMVAFVVVVAVWANRGWTDTQQLVTPKGAPLEYAAYRCSAPFRADSPGVLSGVAPKLAVPRTPCRDHGTRRTVAAVDLAIGVVGIGVLVVVGRRFKASGSPAMIQG